MKRSVLAVVVALLCITLSGCTKNQFSVRVEKSGGMSPMDLQLVYYAADKAKGAVQTISIPGSLYGRQDIVCPVLKPAVVLVYAGSSQMSTFFVARRGDKILLHFNDGLWTASGSKINDRLAQWQSAHKNIILGHATTEINSAVAEFVKGNPDDELSLLLLHFYFDRRDTQKEYTQLYNSLSEKAHDKELLAAIGAMAPAPMPKNATTLLSLRAPGDSILQIRMSAAPATLLHFWYSPNQRRSRTAILRKSSVAGLRIVDVNMQADTISWRRQMQNDSTSTWLYGWAPGGEQNSSIASLGVPSPEFIILLDSKGMQRYRGTDVKEALDAAKKLLKK